METAAGAIKALFVVMIINKLVLQGAVILGPSDPYIRLVNRHLAFLLHGICYHDGVMLRTFHECIKSWMMRGVSSPLLWHQVVVLELTRARLAQPMSRRRVTALAENSPDVLDLLWVGIRPAGRQVTNE